MQRTSVVLDVEVLHEGQTHTASYFVEHGVIHAKIGERILLIPLMSGDAAEKVRALLRGHLLQASRKLQLAMAWEARTAPSSEDARRGQRGVTP